MKFCKLTVKDQVNVKFDGLDPHIRRKISEKLKFLVPNARHLPSVKLKRWDGKVSFCSVGGATYLNLLDRILQTIINDGYEIELVDNRPEQNFTFPKIDENFLADRFWPEGHPLEGEPIILREHQVDAINRYLENQQSLQEICTGAGKCCDYNTEIEVEVDGSSEFGKFLTTNSVSNCHPLFDKNVDVFRVKMGYLVESVSKFQNTELKYNQEISASDLGIRIGTNEAHKSTPITHVIKKKCPLVTISFACGHELKCADKHILYSNGEEIFAKDLRVGQTIHGVTKPFVVSAIAFGDQQDFYDISVPAPHLYRDAAGIIHHNTIITACLSLLVEQITEGRSIVIVPSKSLVTQTEEDYRNVGLDVGVFFGERKEFGHKHTICTWQSLTTLAKKTRRDEATISIDEFLDGVNCVIVDEAHVAKGKELKDALCGEMAHIPLRWGLTGTIPKEEHEFMCLLTSIGPVVGAVKAIDLIRARIHPNISIEILQIQDQGKEFKDYDREYAYLTSDQNRLEWMSKFAVELSESGNTIILVQSVEVGKKLQALIPGSSFVWGDIRLKERKKEYDSFRNATNKIIIATYGVAAVGINIPTLRNMIVYECGKSFTRTIQSAGRLLRKIVGVKEEVFMYDVTSSLKFSKRHLTERKKFYDEAEYPYIMKKIHI